MKFGLIPEFVGRLPVIATLEDLDEDALKKILTEPKNALVKQYQRLFEMENTDLTFQEEALVVVAKKAIERRTGARGLRSIMEGILLDTMFELPGLDGVEQVVIGPRWSRARSPPLHLRRARRAGGLTPCAAALLESRAPAAHLSGRDARLSRGGSGMEFAFCIFDALPPRGSVSDGRSAWFPGRGSLSDV